MSQRLIAAAPGGDKMSLKYPPCGVFDQQSVRSGKYRANGACGGTNPGASG